MNVFPNPPKNEKGVARDTSAMADGLPVALAVSTAVPVPPPDAPLSQPLLPDRDDGPRGEEQIRQLRAQGFTEGKEPRRWRISSVAAPSSWSCLPLTPPTRSRSRSDFRFLF